MHSWLDSCDLLLFDFDGLLVDTEPLHHLAYTSALKERGYDLSWDFSRYMQFATQSKHSLSDEVYALFPDLREQVPDWGTIREEKQVHYLHLLRSNPPQFMPGAFELLKEIQSRKKKCAIVTNSQRVEVETVANTLPEIRKIPLWVTRGDCRRAKPHPDLYLKGLELLATRGDRVVGFEDAWRGIDALIAAKVFPVFICPENHPQFKVGRPLPCRRYDSFIALESYDRLNPLKAECQL